MSREIKFRVWTGEKMIYIGHARNDTSIIFNENGWQVIDHLTGQPEVIADSETSELTECTGGKDSQGKWIYDGDIIEFDEREWGGKDNIHIVSWNEYDYAWCFGGGGAQSDMEWRTVIGNIYENPELINK